MIYKVIKHEISAIEIQGTIEVDMKTNFYYDSIIWTIIYGKLTVVIPSHHPKSVGEL